MRQKFGGNGSDPKVTAGDSWQCVLGRYFGEVWWTIVGNVSGARHQWTRGDVHREEQGDSFQLCTFCQISIDVMFVRHESFC